ncbi:MAG TPA: hypothetical protein VFD36_20695 [Kofleriaceae bacterium]|nr:hypothetical protein [Kofleriaceae bacterium]
MDTRLESMRARVASLETRDDIVSMRESLVRQTDRIASIEAAASGRWTAKPDENLLAAVKAQGDMIAQLKAETSDAESEVGHLRGVLVSVQARLAELQGYQDRVVENNDKCIRLQDQFDRLALEVSSMTGHLLSEDSQRDMARMHAETEKAQAFLRRCEAVFQPIVDSMQRAPLDGEQVASKAWVDEAISRIAKAIRAEMEVAREKFRADWIAKISASYDMTKALGEKLGQGAGDGAITIAFAVANKLAQLWTREEERQRAAQQPTRLESFVHALTGGRRNV